MGMQMEIIQRSMLQVGSHMVQVGGLRLRHTGGSDKLSASPSQDPSCHGQGEEMCS